MPKTFRLVCCVLGALLAAQGCSSSNDESRRDMTVVEVGRAGGRAVAGDVTVKIPAGAVQGSGRLSVERQHLDRRELPSFVEPIGSGVAIELSGAQLKRNAVVRWSDVAAPSADRPLVAVWQDGTSWRWLPTKRAGRGVEATTNHFSLGFLASVDVKRWANDRAASVRNYVTSRAGVKQPTCGDEKALRDAGVKVSSDGGDTVKWCAGIDGGRRVLRVANNRRTYTEIAYPSGWKILDGGGGGISLDALIRSTSGWIDGLTAPDGTSVRMLDGGSTITLGLPDNRSGTVTAEMGITAWLLSGIRLGTEVFAAVAGAAKSKLGAAASTSWQRFLGEVNAGDPTKGWSSALEACVTSFTDHITDKRLDGSNMATTGTAILKFAWGCVPDMMKADLDASGVAFFGSGVIISAVATAVGFVLAAAHLILSGAREVWDSVASFGGSSDTIYDIKVRAPSAPTRWATDHPELVCQAVESRIVNHAESPDWVQLVAQLGADPENYPNFGGVVEVAPTSAEVLRIFVVSATGDSIQRIDVAPNGSISAPIFVWGGPGGESDEPSPYEADRSVGISAGQTGMSVERLADDSPYCSFRF